jgi:phospholipase/lecithinase/hemolysin
MLDKPFSEWQTDGLTNGESRGLTVSRSLAARRRLPVLLVKRHSALIGCTSVALALLVGGVLQAKQFSRLVVFGDSTTDTGNVYELSGQTKPASPPYFEGRWSNGPLWIEYLADRLGVPRPRPSLVGGTNYAYAGAQTGIGESMFEGLKIPKIGTQIRSFFQSGGTLTDGDLVVMWAGFNDFNASFGGHGNASLAASNLASHFRELIDHGGRSSLLANLGTGQPTFNRLWWEQIDTLERAHPEIDVHRLDFAQLVTRVLTSPAAYGFVNVSTPALDVRTGRVVPNPEQYAIWDAPPGSHMTTTAHRIIADTAFQAIVPEPTSCQLLAVPVIVSLGFGATVWRRRRLVSRGICRPLIARWLYPNRAAHSHRHHRRSGRPAAAGGASRARSGTAASPLNCVGYSRSWLHNELQMYHLREISYTSFTGVA